MPCDYLLMQPSPDRNHVSDPKENASEILLVRALDPIFDENYLIAES